MHWPWQRRQRACALCGLTACPGGERCSDVIRARRALDATARRLAHLACVLTQLQRIYGQPIPFGPLAGRVVDRELLFRWYSLVWLEGYGESTTQS